MKAKVSKLSLFGFRGATQPVEIHFDISKPVTLVFGENGTGKSTIADALDFVAIATSGRWKTAACPRSRKAMSHRWGKTPRN
ncbi:MAG TPA: ATP-binding protein [Verrucomicrobiae bacterium]|jgi:predicted ATPase|nr:ATP-binding protein [Verrucomicrobiae bacterium]